jgi:CIC family chloride channel protein
VRIDTLFLLSAANQLRRRIRTSEALFLALAVSVGIVAGLMAVAIALVAHGAQFLLFALPEGVHLSAAGHVAPLRLLFLPIGGALLGVTIWGVRRRKPIDVVEANALHGGRIPPADTFTVVGQTVLSNAFGASVGLEAAYAQAGGGYAAWLGMQLNLRRNDLRTLVGAGAGAALSAAFGAPLTGAFYAFEIVLGAYTPATVAPVGVAALAAALTARSLGATPYVIAAGSSHTIVTADYLLYGLLGLACGALGIGIMRLIAATERLVHRTNLPMPFRPLVGGVLLIPLGLATPQALSAGHGALNLDLISDLSLRAVALILALKIAASSISLGFGFRGGLFFASLFAGSLLGRLYALLLGFIPHLHPLSSGDAAIVGMAALAVAIVGGPMTMAMLVLEVTHDFAITGVAITAALISSSLVRESFGYSFSTWRLHLRGETLRSGRDIGWVRSLTAGRMMRHDVATVADDLSVAAFRERFPLGSTTRVVLRDASGRYAGIVPTATAFTSAVATDTPIGTLAILKGAALTMEMDIAAIMQAFDDSEADDLAVLRADGTVAGVLTEKHARKRYAEELEKSQRELFGED